MKKFLSEIKGYEECDNYIIYDTGEIYSMYVNRFLKLSIDSNGYQYIDLRGMNTPIKNPKIHRLVMLAFSKEKQKEQINHVDGNKLNNDIKNLEWCTNKENRIHAINNNLKDEVMYGIAQYDLNNNLINVFETCEKALEHLGKDIKYSGNIGRVIRGKRKTAYGFKWKQYKGSTTITGE